MTVEKNGTSTALSPNQAAHQAAWHQPSLVQRIWSGLLQGLRGLLPLWPLLLPVILLIPSLGAFPYASKDAAFSDLVISHYPNALFLRESLVKYHTVPLWSPTILSGYPFAADPLSGLWYPPGWIALLLPLPLGFNLLVLVHLLWGGLGMYRLLRGERLAHLAALLGAMAFEALPKLFAHYGAGHLTLLYAVPWTPWLLFVERRAAVRRDRPVSLAQPGLVLAMIFLADVRWAVYAGVLWVAYSLSLRWDAGVIRRLLHLLFQAAMGALLSAPLALPLLEYTRLSTRAHLTSSDVFAFSLPPGRILGLLFPDLGGFQEWVLYSGGAVLVLGLLAVLWSRSRAGIGFWIWTAILSLIYSLGSNIPFLSLLTRLPGFDLLRVPSRALFLTGLAMAALAAFAVDHLLQEKVSPLESRRIGLLLTGLAAFTLALAGGVWFLSGRLPLEFAWGAGMVLAAALWIILRMRARLSPLPWVIGLLVLCSLDWGYVDLSLFAPRPVSAVWAEGQEVAQYLASQPGRFRVYSPSYSLPQQTAARAGIDLVDGVDPLQLQSYATFMKAASGVPWTGYSVTLPPFANGEPASDNAGYQPDPSLLGLLNVRYLVAAFDLPEEGLVLKARFGNTRIYENSQVLPRSWVQPLHSAPGVQARSAQITNWTPDQIDITADVPGGEGAQLLILSEVMYPGWQVWVDGKPSQIQVEAGLLRGVRLEPGIHQVVFRFEPRSVYLGLGLWAVGLFLALAAKRFSNIVSIDGEK